MTAFDLTTHESRDEWLAAREGVGASEIAAVVGLNRHESLLSLWARKVGAIEDEPDNLRMAFGRRIEGIVLDLFAEQTGLVVDRGGLTIARSHSHPWAFCSPDGFVYESDEHIEPLGVVEAKSTSMRVDLDDMTDVYAAAWIAQVQWQLFVTGFEHGWLAVLDSFRDEVRVEPVKRDEEAIEWLVAEGERFWRFVDTQTEPPQDAHPESLRVYPRLWPAASGAEVQIEPELATAVVEARRDLTRAAQRFEEAKADVLTAMRFDNQTSAEYACVGAKRVARFTPSRRLDADAIERDHDVSAFIVPRFDVQGWAKANRKESARYRTIEKSRSFVVIGLDKDDT